MNARMTFLARFAVFTVAIGAPALFAQTPIANTVPFVASNPISPHTSWSGNPVTLKGTLTSSAFGTHTFTYDWDPGDGGPHCTGTVTNQYDIECAHTYTGSVGSASTAVLTITDTTNSLVSPASNCPLTITQGACYYTQLYAPPPNLSIEVNNAIDNGLWYIHKTMVHGTSTYGAPIGYWYGNGDPHDNTASAGDHGPDALYCTAFEVSGFLTTNTPANPYSSDVSLCLSGVFDQMTTRNMGSLTPLSFPSFTPDYNGNGIGVEARAPGSGYTNYQTGMTMDAINASGTPTAVVTAGTYLGNIVTGANKGSGPGGAYTFKDAIIDAVDDYSYCENLGESGFYSAGGWHYTCQEAQGDNSVSQWAAIGIIPARRNYGTDPLNPEVLLTDQAWLTSSFTQASVDNGYFGYTSSSPLWGPWAVTPSGLVQLAMNGKGRGTTVSGTNLWDSAETYIRDGFGSTAGSGNSLKSYYYGMFSFTKAMLLHDNSGTGLSNTPITLLQSLDDPSTCAAPGVPVTSPGSGTGPCYPPIDWYGAQTSAFGGTDPTNGVARTLVSTQYANGSWYGDNYTSSQYYFETAIAVIMLNKTVFNAVPVACFTVSPNHIASGGSPTLNGNCSVEQNPSNTLVSWQWDVSGTGAGYTIGPGNAKCKTNSCSTMQTAFTLPMGATLPYSFPVKLLLTDSGGLTSTVTGSVIISAPPNPPNAVAGGPYNFCPNTTGGPMPSLIYQPFLLDGSHSTNPDQGTTDGTPNAPLSTIVAYDWDYSCSGVFNSAHTAQVDVTSAFNIPADYGTSFNVCLRVTNNDLCSTSAGQSANPPLCAYPTGAVGTLSSQTSAQVTIHNTTDEVCTHCVQSLGATPKAPTPGVPGTIQLYFTDTNTSTQFTIDHYNIYRSTSASFSPFTQIAGANSSPFIPAVQVSSPAGGLLYFKDANVVGGTTYYYRVAPATANDTETCQGNVTLAVTLPKGR